MKILIYSDNHWSQHSSIVRRRGSRYSLRLENQIQSINWANELADVLKCSAIFCLGDFFDKADLNSEELTALREIIWPEIPYYFVVGNHEMGLYDHLYSSMKVFTLLSGATVLDSACCFDFGNTEVCILPYMLEDQRKELNQLFHPRTDKKRVILSHNDLKGYQMGPYVSKIGVELDEIEQSCDLFINGHLHNGGSVTSKIINIGNLTGQNFSEDANKYPHTAAVLDTDTLSLEVYENPYALNFYKLEITDGNLSTLDTLKTNSVITVKCDEHLVETVRSKIANNPNIVESRVILNRVLTNQEDSASATLMSLDHLEEFKKYVLENMGSTEVIEEELSEVLKS